MSGSDIVVAVCTFSGAAFWFGVVLFLAAHTPGKDADPPPRTCTKRPLSPRPVPRPTAKAGRRAAPTGTWC